MIYDRIIEDTDDRLNHIEEDGMEVLKSLIVVSDVDN